MMNMLSSNTTLRNRIATRKTTNENDCSLQTEKLYRTSLVPREYDTSSRTSNTMAGGTETEAEREKRKKAEKKRMEAPKNRSEVTPTRSVQDPRAGLSHHSDDHAKPQGDHYRGHPEAKRGPSGSHPARGVDATESTNDQASSYRDDPARLDGSDLHRRGKLFRAQSRQFCSSNVNANHGTLV